MKYVALAAALLFTLSIWTVRDEQPFEFPHDRHVAMGLECISCHRGANVRAAAGIPSVRNCMLCHQTLATDLPGVRELQRYAERNIEIPWKRVYRFEPGARVKFQHAPHVLAGIECGTCHGEVEKMTVVVRTVKHNMGTCVSCHRQEGATTDCIACHY